MGTELTVYTRADCHLCEDMAAQLESLSAELGFNVRFIDIDDADEEGEALLERFGSRVPVLMKQDQFICEHFLDQSALKQALSH